MAEWCLSNCLSWHFMRLDRTHEARIDGVAIAKEE